MSKNDSDSDDDVPIAQLAKKRAVGTKPTAKAPANRAAGGPDSDDDDDDDKPIAQLIKSNKAAPEGKAKKGAKGKADEPAPKAKKTDKSEAADKPKAARKTKEKAPAKDDASSRKRKEPSAATASKKARSAAAPVGVLGERKLDLEKPLKPQAVNAILCRWSYCMQWPPAGMHFDVPNKDWVELLGIPGVFVGVLGDETGKFRDDRPMEGRPCYSELIKKPAADLKAMWKQGVEAQLEELRRVEPDSKLIQQLLNELKQIGNFDVAKADKQHQLAGRK